MRTVQRNKLIRMKTSKSISERSGMCIFEYWKCREETIIPFYFVFFSLWTVISTNQFSHSNTESNVVASTEAHTRRAYTQTYTRRVVILFSSFYEEIKKCLCRFIPLWFNWVINGWFFLNIDVYVRSEYFDISHISK